MNDNIVSIILILNIVILVICLSSNVNGFILSYLVFLIWELLLAKILLVYTTAKEKIKEMDLYY